jgi:phage-related protein
MARTLEAKVVLDNKQAMGALGDVETKGSSTAKNLSAHYKNLGGTMTASFAKAKILVDAVYAVGSKAFDFMKTAITDSASADAALTKLTTSMKANGSYTKELADRYIGFANAVQASTSIEGDAVTALMGKIGDISKKTGDDLEKTTKLTLSFAQMFKKEGQDTISVADKQSASIAKMAKSGDFSVLEGKLGLAKGSIKSLDDALRATNQGWLQAQAETKDFAGATAQLTNIWGDLKEFLGSFITQSPQVQAAIQGTSKFIAELTNYLSTGNLDPSTTFGQLATFFQALSAQTAPLRDAMAQLWSYLSSPEGVTAMQESWNQVVAVFQAAGEQLKPMWDAIVSFFSAGWELLKALWVRYGDEITLVATTLWEGIKAIFSTAWNIISTAFQIALTALSGIFKVFADLLKGDWSGAWEDMKATQAKIWSIISSAVKTQVDIFTNWWSGCMNATKEYWSGVWKGIHDTVVNWFSKAVAWVEGKINAIKEKFAWLYDVLVGHSIVPDMANEVVRYFRLMGDDAVLAVDSLTTKTQDSFGALGDIMISDASIIADRVNEQFGRITTPTLPAVPAASYAALTSPQVVGREDVSGATNVASKPAYATDAEGYRLFFSDGTPTQAGLMFYGEEAFKKQNKLTNIGGLATEGGESCPGGT